MTLQSPKQRTGCVRGSEGHERGFNRCRCKGGKQHAAKRGRPGTKAGPGGNGIQLKEGKLEMSIREDFLAVRTAGFEHGLPREGREAPSLRTLETAQSHTVRATAKEETLPSRRMHRITCKAFAIWSYFDYSNIILQGCRKGCRG